jgi:NDP-sugar pyrophosphorylase family protein
MIVIPLAGKSTRFRNEGINIPKWSLEVGDKTVLSRAIESILESRNGCEKILIGLPASLYENFDESLDPKIIGLLEVVELDDETSGQADTVYRMLQKQSFDKSERLVIWCGDSAFRADAFNFGAVTGNWILVSELPGDHWSFVKVLEGKVVEVAEKRRISDFTSLGLYAFETIETFLGTSPDVIHPEYEESFVAPLFNRLIDQNNNVKFFQIEAGDYFRLGTPVELIETCLRMKWELPAELANQI